jgi:hypothetical protein
MKLLAGLQFHKSRLLLGDNFHISESTCWCREYEKESNDPADGEKRVRGEGEEEDEEEAITFPGKGFRRSQHMASQGMG